MKKLGDYDEPIVSIVNCGAYLFVATQKNVYYHKVPDYQAPYVFIPLYVRAWRWIKKHVQF